MNDIIIQQADFLHYKNDIASVRNQVFVEELKIPKHLEWDGSDNAAWHSIAKHNYYGVIGCGRLLADAHIGRIAVLAKWRNKGIGSMLLSHLCKLAANKKYSTVYLSAQQTAIAFYQNQGFEISGKTFITADIPHIPMTKVLSCTKI